MTRTIELTSGACITGDADIRQLLTHAHQQLSRGLRPKIQDARCPSVMEVHNQLHRQLIVAVDCNPQNLGPELRPPHSPSLRAHSKQCKKLICYRRGSSACFSRPRASAHTIARFNTVANQEAVLHTYSSRDEGSSDDWVWPGEGHTGLHWSASVAPTEGRRGPS